MIKKAIKYFFKSICILFQLANKQRGTSKVVNMTKNIEMPSTPKGKLMFKTGIHKNLSTNWKVPMDLSKKTHKNKEEIKVKQEKFSTMDFKWLLF